MSVKKISGENKANVFCSIMLVALGLFGKILQNNDSGKIVPELQLNL